ncbi:hypothetical protein VNO80_08484 [Phaseolus coccineus]|uniref:DUF4378 domain-containing protein n=1 Tax=Phaseolus coccineus TaxID=3886 RepID=A0AAN9N9P9_PHACN
MDTSDQQSTKQLKDHLQHHQEPFSLQSYLIERSYMFNNLSSESTNIHQLYSAKNLKWSIKYDLHKIRKRLVHAIVILRSLLSTEDSQEFSNWDEEHNSDLYYVHEHLTAHTQATRQTSSPKTLAMSHHFTNNEAHHKVLPTSMIQTFTLPKLKRSEVDAGTKPYWISLKENRQPYSRGPECKAPLPNAACDLKSSDAVPTLSQKLVRDYVRKLVTSSNILKFRRAKKEKLEEMVGTGSSCGRNRRSFDNVEKDRGLDGNEGKSVSGKAVSEAEGFEMIDEHFNVLEKQHREGKKMRHLVHADSCVISEEWKSFEIVNLEIYMEVGDSITDDIVSEIIYLF